MSFAGHSRAQEKSSVAPAAHMPSGTVAGCSHPLGCVEVCDLLLGPGKARQDDVNKFKA